MIKHFSIFILLLLFTALQPTGAARADVMTISNTEAGWLPILADVLGAFREEEVAVEVINETSGVAALEKLIAGKADFATASDFAFVSTVGEARNLRIIASIATINTVRLVARRDRIPAGVNGIIGRKIGLKLNSYSEYYLGRLLALSGLPDDAVKIVDIRPDRLPNALARGHVDGIVSWEPHANDSRMAADGQSYDVAIRGGHPFYYLLVTREDVLKNQPAAVRAVLKSLLNAADFASREKDGAKRRLATALEVTARYLEQTWDDNGLLVSLPQDLLFSMEEEARWRRHKGVSGISDAVPDYLSMVDYRPLLALDPLVVTIIR